MGSDKLNNGILKIVNYHNADLEKFKKSAEYVLNPKSTPPEFRFTRYLNREHPARSLSALEKRWKGETHGRLFKHIVCSFGDPELNPSKAFAITKEIVDFYRDFPVLFGIHTNIPTRIHAHILLGMTNVGTGKRYSQGPREFNAIRRHFNDVVRSHGLLGIRGMVTAPAIVSPPYESSDDDRRDCDALSYDEEDAASPEYFRPSPLMSGVIGMFREDFQTFFQVGFMLGGKGHGV